MTTNKSAINKPENSQKTALISYRRFLKWATKTAIMVALLCFFWISVDGYHRLVSRKIVKKSAHLIKPLNPEIDYAVIGQIEKKKFFDLSQTNSVLVQLLQTEEEVNEEE